MKIINEFTFSEELSKEGINAWWNYKFKKFYIIFGIFSIVFMIAFFIKQEISYLPAILMPALFYLLTKYRANKSIMIEKERIEMFFKNEWPVYHIEISDVIVLTQMEKEITIEFKDVLDFVETDHLIVIMIRASLTIPILKKGFIEGTSEECIALLKKIYVENRLSK